MSITTNLKMYLVSRGIKQAHIAYCCDIPRDRLYKILNGTRKLQVDELLRISRHLQITVEQLESGAGLFD